MDGTTYEPYLVTNDWPIHPSHIAMQLTVGACWQGNMAVESSILNSKWNFTCLDISIMKVTKSFWYKKRIQINN